MGVLLKFAICLCTPRVQWGPGGVKAVRGCLWQVALGIQRAYRAVVVGHEHSTGHSARPQNDSDAAGVAADQDLNVFVSKGLCMGSRSTPGTKGAKHGTIGQMGKQEL